MSQGNVPTCVSRIGRREIRTENLPVVLCAERFSCGIGWQGSGATLTDSNTSVALTPGRPLRQS